MYKLSMVFLLMALPTFADSEFANSEKLRDPTMPMGQRVATQANPEVALTLNSILISNQRRVAVINGQALRQGETIKGSAFHVVAINNNSVTVQANNTTRVLSLVDSKVKK